MNVSCDISPAYISGVESYLPNARITFDKFHIVKTLNKAVDDVLNAIQTKLRDAGIFHNWATLRSRLASHYRLTTSMKRFDGKMLYIRKPSKPEECHKLIYDALGLSHQPGGVCKTII